MWTAGSAASWAGGRCAPLGLAMYWDRMPGVWRPARCEDAGGRAVVWGLPGPLLSGKWGQLEAEVGVTRSWKVARSSCACMRRQRHFHDQRMTHAAGRTTPGCSSARATKTSRCSRASCSSSNDPAKTPRRERRQPRASRPPPRKP
ncbi:hypothetical protein C8R45DRAFT_1002223 [Mycena sanguinolenta]|nr:hypothetical protein C8R45DRAFT_1002223 [Mycena sanguinolenta]